MAAARQLAVRARGRSEAELEHGTAVVAARGAIQSCTKPAEVFTTEQRS